MSNYKTDTKAYIKISKQKFLLKNIKFLILLLALESCYFFGPSPMDDLTTKNLNKKPSQSEMVGIWEVDTFSYDLHLEKGYEKKKIVLELKNDGTFEISNLPNFINTSDQTNKKYVNVRGTWEINKEFSSENWVLYIHFNKSNLYVNGMSTTYDLYLQDDEIIIWSFIGDPDSGYRFLYRKK